MLGVKLCNKKSTRVSVDIVDARGVAVEVVVGKFGELTDVRLELVAVAPTPDETFAIYKVSYCMMIPLQYFNIPELHSTLTFDQ